MVKELEVVIETPPNTDIREYHVRFEPSECLFREVGKIIGVVDAHDGNKYSVYVVKGVAFSWDEIEPIVLELLKEADAYKNCEGGTSKINKGLINA